MTPAEAALRLQTILNIRATVAAFLLRVSRDPKWRRT